MELRANSPALSNNVELFSTFEWSVLSRRRKQTLASNATIAICPSLEGADAAEVSRASRGRSLLCACFPISWRARCSRHVLAAKCKQSLRDYTTYTGTGYLGAGCRVPEYHRTLLHRLRPTQSCIRVLLEPPRSRILPAITPPEFSIPLSSVLATRWTCDSRDDARVIFWQE